MNKIYKLSSFPAKKYGGNPAGVVLDADNLTSEDMLKIAKDVNFSETAFVMHSDNADFKVKFFTPTNEVDLCGHATIATFSLMKQLDLIKDGKYTQETKAGILEIYIQDDFVYMEQKLPTYGVNLDKSMIERCFHNTDFLDERFPISIVSTGLFEIFLPVKSFDDLNHLEYNSKKIMELSEMFGAIGIHAFSLDKVNEYDANCRNFAPVVGIDEESATGTSNGALACYFAKYVEKKTSYVFGQGYTMGKPSEINVKLEYTNDEISKVLVGGNALIIK